MLEWEGEYSHRTCRVVMCAKASACAGVCEQGLELELASETLHVDCTVGISMLNYPLIHIKEPSMQFKCSS